MKLVHQTLGKYSRLGTSDRNCCLTTEAEYLAFSEAIGETRRLAYLHRDVTGEIAVPLIRCDSNGALSTMRSTATSDKAKYIDVPSSQFSASRRYRYRQIH